MFARQAICIQVDSPLTIKTVCWSSRAWWYEQLYYTLSPITKVVGHL